MNVTIAATMQVANTNGRNSRNGDIPAAFMTMISESVASLLSVCETAIISAIGAITPSSDGITRLVMPRKVRMVWPWLVIRSMPRNAWVIQITPVRLTRTNANDASVVRKMYLSMDPIVCAQSPIGSPGTSAAATLETGPQGCCRRDFPRAVNTFTIPLIRRQNGCGVAPRKYG